MPAAEGSSAEFSDDEGLGVTVADVFGDEEEEEEEADSRADLAPWELGAYRHHSSLRGSTGLLHIKDCFHDKSIHSAVKQGTYLLPIC